MTGHRSKGRVGGNARRKSATKIAYILGSYPGNMETFVFNEMEELARIGFDIYACPIHFIPENGKKGWMPNAIYAERSNLPRVLLSHMFFIFTRPATYLKCLLKHKSYGGKRVFLKSAHFARTIKKLGIGHIHSHFGWTATDAARVIALLTDIPFSFSLHAADIYWLQDNLETKLREANFVLTCVKNNKTYLSGKFGEAVGRKIEVVYHGVNLEIFRPVYEGNKDIDVLSIGRLVEKKGHRYLIKAYGILKSKGISPRCLIVGRGPEKERLESMIGKMGLEDSVKIQDSRQQSELPSIYAKSKVFALPSNIAETGDRDGIPNVLMEAMAMGLPVVSCNLPNIAELIEDGKDGVLVRQKDPDVLAAAIEGLLNDADKCASIGRMATLKITEKFDAKKHIKTIASMFENGKSD